MKFSIIIPVYNVEKYIVCCLNSALNQDYKDYEIIVVNDGSTDHSLSILKKYEQRYGEKIKIINQCNKGLGGARNTGIAFASGDYLFFLDSDDYISTHTLSILNEYIKEYNVDILAFDCTRVDINHKIIDTITYSEFHNEWTILTKKQFMLFEPTFCTKVYKRSLFVDNKIYFPEKKWYEDLATLYKLVPHISRIGYLKKSLYYYLQQDESITHSKNIERMFEITQAISSTITYFKNLGVYDCYKSELEYICVLHSLYYSAFRVFSCGYKIKEMNRLNDYCKLNFPDYKKNKYVVLAFNKKYMFKAVINKHYFSFYVREYLIPHFLKRIRVNDDN